MIRLSFDILSKYEMQHFENLKDKVDELIKSLPSPYQISSQTENCACCSKDSRNEWRRKDFCEKCQFAYDLLTNPFESDFLFLKEYFLTVQLIIESIKSFDSQILNDYSDNLHIDSIFREIITSKEITDQNDYIFLLKQFIAKRKDIGSSTTYNDLDEKLKKILVKHPYEKYDVMQAACVSFKSQYGRFDKRTELIG